MFVRRAADILIPAVAEDSISSPGMQDSVYSSCFLCAQLFSFVSIRNFPTLMVWQRVFLLSKRVGIYPPPFFAQLFLVF